MNEEVITLVARVLAWAEGGEPAEVESLGKDPVYLTRFAKPLAEAIAEAQDMLPGFAPDIETCDEGYCWT